MIARKDFKAMIFTMRWLDHMGHFGDTFLGPITSNFMKQFQNVLP